MPSRNPLVAVTIVTAGTEIAIAPEHELNVPAVPAPLMARTLNEYEVPSTVDVRL